MSTYGLLLFAHSYVRWGVLLGCAVVLFRSARAWQKRRAWTSDDERWHSALLSGIDTQLLLGLLLYGFFSPLSRAFFSDPKHAVHDHVLRFFGLEHAATMLAAVTLFHVGRSLSKKKPAGQRQRTVFLFTFLAFALVCSAIPWPGLRHGRPLARGFWAGSDTLGVVRPACPPSYAQDCAACHGLSGKGDGVAAASLEPRPRDFTATAWAESASDSDIRALIRDGGAVHGRSAAMPAHPQLTPAELAELVRCIRSFRAAAK